MAAAATRLAEIGGGIVVVDEGTVIAECPLPVAGLLSDAPLDEVVARSRLCNEAAARLGWSGATPFLTLAFLALSVIPSLKLTDRGLVDVDRFELVPLRLPAGSGIAERRPLPARTPGVPATGIAAATPGREPQRRSRDQGSPSGDP